MNQRTILILAVPIMGGLLVLGTIALRDGVDAQPAPARKAVVQTSGSEGSVRPSPPPAPLPKAAPEKTISRAMDEARLKTTYQNYRTALATGNRFQADALYPVLMKERKAAVQLAQQDLAQAQQEFDRSVAAQALAALRR